MIFFHAEPLISRFSLEKYITLLQQLWQTVLMWNLYPIFILLNQLAVKITPAESFLWMHLHQFQYLCPSLHSIFHCSGWWGHWGWGCQGDQPADAGSLMMEIHANANLLVERDCCGLWHAWGRWLSLNIKTVLSTYGDFHVKDKTAVRTSYL